MSVKYPPSVAGGRALVGSGDGYVYAFGAATGPLLWRFRAAPVDRRIRVYDSLLSTWPVATGVLVDGQTAYCAAGINNYDGTHVYALDASSGAIKWHNSSPEGMGAVLGAGVDAIEASRRVSRILTFVGLGIVLDAGLGWWATRRTTAPPRGR